MVVVTPVTSDTLRLNLGCGDYPLDGYLNVDAVHGPGVDLVISVPPLPWADASVSDIYCGHFFEHLPPQTGHELLRECHRVLTDAGQLGVVVPDFREIARRYVRAESAPFEWAGETHDMADLDELCTFMLFATVQPFPHRWAYDIDTLGRALHCAGFDVLYEIDRYHDVRLSTPRWYQTGLQARRRAM